MSIALDALLDDQESGGEPEWISEEGRMLMHRRSESRHVVEGAIICVPKGALVVREEIEATSPSRVKTPVVAPVYKLVDAADHGKDGFFGLKGMLVEFDAANGDARWVRLEDVDLLARVGEHKLTYDRDKHPACPCGWSCPERVSKRQANSRWRDHLRSLAEQ